MKNILFIFLLIMTTKLALAVDVQEFIDLAKKTRSVYSMSADVDANNAANLSFETLLNNQKAELLVSATHLNSSTLTLINSNGVGSVASLAVGFSVMSLASAPEIEVFDLKLIVDPTEVAPSTCNGDNIIVGDKSCTSRNCTITQRVIAQCNVDDCWEIDSSTDRDIIAPLSESFRLVNTVDISDCIPSNIEGVKHVLNLTSANESASNLRGGSINFSLILQNDVAL